VASLTVKLITACQACGSRDLEPIVSLGLIALVNDYRPVGEPAAPQTLYPHDLLRCPRCELAQFGLDIPPDVVFPRSYPYSSSTTRALRDNFADLYREVTSLVALGPEDLVLDIGGNDGNLLSNFAGKHRVLNVTPEDIGKLGEERGVPHFQDYWDGATAASVENAFGKARVITATNVFAHVPDLNGFIEAQLATLAADGLLVFECQYFGDTIDGVQYDNIYAEHRAIYSVTSMRNLLRPHGLEIFRFRSIATHGGSIRYYVRRGNAAAVKQLAERLEFESKAYTVPRLAKFRSDVALRRRQLWGLQRNPDDHTTSSLPGESDRIVGIGAPSRAGTLIGYTKLDESVIDYVCETPGSHKLGHYMPGTRIPVVDETRLYEEQPEFALLFAHHIAVDLITATRAKGYRGKFIVPLPCPRVVTDVTGPTG
jgi:hypothetical protein